jgi:Spy/CpxP family protein refolding chaperone
MNRTSQVLLTVALPLVLAAGCGGMHNHHADFDPARADKQVTEHIEDVLEDVKASDAQKAHILGIKNRLLPEVAALMGSQPRVRQEMVAQLTSDHPDAARLHALVDQQVDAFRAVAHKSIDGVLEAHATLTPEQRAPLMKKMRRFASR